MDLHISTIRLGVDDVARARPFYELGLGCSVLDDDGGTVVLGLGDHVSRLALTQRRALADELGAPSEHHGFSGHTLSFLVETPDDVDAVMASGTRHGGSVGKPAKSAFWGGYSGYLRDPDGVHWKIASPQRRHRSGRAAGSAGAEAAPPAPTDVPLTFGVADLSRAKAFYRAVGARVDKEFGSKFASFDLGPASSSLALYPRAALAKDAGVDPEGDAVSGVGLTVTCDTDDEVAALVAAAEAAGGTSSLVEPGTGRFVDLDGVVWQVTTRAAARRS